MSVLRFLVRNWPLKLGAIVLAVILYVGMVALQNAEAWPGQVPIEPVNQPGTAVLTEPNPLPLVGNIRFVAPPDVAARISKDSFRATIDLASVKVSESDTSQLVRVQLVANDDRIQILDYAPQQIRVTLDPLIHKSVRVQVDTGPIPSGLTMPNSPVLSTDSVDVFGPSSIVKLVAAAQARVGIDASGLDVDQNVDLVALDARGAVLNGVEFNPRNVRVRIQIGSQIRSATVPVNPIIQGAPASGYYVSSVEVKPLVVDVQGEADELAQIKGRANTKPISIEGATSDVSSQVALDLPSGVQAPAVTTVTVTVHLQSPAATRSVTVGVVPDGARSDRIYSLSTPSVTVTIGGPIAALNAFDTSTLVGTVAVGSLDAGTHTVKVSIALPAGIRLVGVNPSEIVVAVVVPPTPPPPTPTPTPAPSPT